MLCVNYSLVFVKIFIQIFSVRHDLTQHVGRHSLTVTVLWSHESCVSMILSSNLSNNNKEPETGTGSSYYFFLYLSVYWKMHWSLIDRPNRQGTIFLDASWVPQWSSVSCIGLLFKLFERRSIQIVLCLPHFDLYKILNLLSNDH